MDGWWSLTTRTGNGKDRDASNDAPATAAASAGERKRRGKLLREWSYNSLPNLMEWHMRRTQDCRRKGDSFSILTIMHSLRARFLKNAYLPPQNAYCPQNRKTADFSFHELNVLVHSCVNVALFNKNFSNSLTTSRNDLRRMRIIRLETLSYSVIIRWTWKRENRCGKYNIHFMLHIVLRNSVNNWQIDNLYILLCSSNYILWRKKVRKKSI